MKGLALFLAGTLFGVAVCGVSAWLWLRHVTRISAEQEGSYPPDAAQELKKAQAELTAASNEYKRCGAFWQHDYGKLNVWQEMVQDGRIPNFGANLVF